MDTLTLSAVTLADIKRYVNLQEKEMAAHAWTQADSQLLSEREQQQLQEIVSHLLNYQVHLMNEATIWARAIYPLLLLAEQGAIQAWAGVPLQARYPQFKVEGIADGVLGRTVAGRVESPYLVVVETKRGVEAQNPVFQLYAQLLAAARLNWENDGHSPQEIFGCYTIADSWTFVRAEIDGIETDLPTMQVESSREYVEKLEAELIFKILKKIVGTYRQGRR